MLGKGEKELPWTQPALSANGTIGGDRFACAASSEQASDGYGAYKAFNNNNDESWFAKAKPPQWLEWYNPVPLKITKIIFATGTTYSGITVSCIKDYIIQASIDGNSWINIYTGVNSVKGVKTIVTANINNVSAYKYWRIYIVSLYDSYTVPCVWQVTITATQIV